MLTQECRFRQRAFTFPSHPEGHRMPLPGLASLQPVLDAAILSDNCCAGNIQLAGADDGMLRIVAHRGFREPFLAHFATVRAGGGSACARAFASGHRIVITDVQADPGFAAHQQAAADASYRAVQSTVVKNRAGRPVGVLSTHYHSPHVPSTHALRAFDRFASIVGLLVECENLAKRTAASYAAVAPEMRDAIRAVEGLLPRLGDRGRTETVAVSLTLELENIVNRLFVQASAIR
jgi:hypothetical protein